MNFPKKTTRTTIHKQQSEDFKGDNENARYGERCGNALTLGLLRLTNSLPNLIGQNVVSLALQQGIIVGKDQCKKLNNLLTQTLHDKKTEKLIKSIAKEVQLKNKLAQFKNLVEKGLLSQEKYNQYRNHLGVQKSNDNPYFKPILDKHLIISLTKQKLKKSPSLIKK